MSTLIMYQGQRSIVMYLYDCPFQIDIHFFHQVMDKSAAIFVQNQVNAYTMKILVESYLKYEGLTVFLHPIRQFVVDGKVAL